MYPEHPYMNPQGWSEAASQAQLAATVLGPAHVNQQLIEAQLQGVQAEEVRAQQLQAEAMHVHGLHMQNQQRMHQSMPAVSTAPAAVTTSSQSVSQAPESIITPPNRLIKNTPMTPAEQRVYAKNQRKLMKKALRELKLDYVVMVCNWSFIAAIPTFMIGSLLLLIISGSAGSAPAAIGFVYLPCLLCIPTVGIIVWRSSFRSEYEDLAKKKNAHRI